MRERIITGVVAGGVFLLAIVKGGLIFEGLVGLLVVIAISELFKMADIQIMSIEGVLSVFAGLSLALPLNKYLPQLGVNSQLMLFTFFVFCLMAGMVFSNGKYTYENIGFPFLTAFYIGIGFQNLINARTNGLFTIFLALFIVWATDIGAYFVGRQFGKHKLIPSVSPNKTIEGSLGGIASAVVVSLIMFVGFSKYAPSIPLWQMVILTIIFSMVAQLGDLVESSIKRQYGVKDSGKILPGHGGILDRFDSMLFVFPIMHLFGLF
ncbi:phosphatidate cytidylyltransferase [Floricoccus tropicus]|uniref:Phosphatidate cytidylyltransferase n=1 Tax=Floricoccus tropicus TaxID=1859473 RepID=A0A1E8GK45_9LACT|nr:phosphatidate cytidylyltransferase [Floricoccus tropicus]OFI48614.1 phosphatidate cytidylyltransferase [Floricoccus tropicus]